MRIAGRRYLAALVIGCALMPGVAPEVARAQAAGDIAGKRSDLDDLKKRIRELQQEMSRTEANRSGAAKALAESEREVSRAQRRVLQLQRERAEADAQLAELERAQREAEARIASRRGELAEWLRRHYVHGAADGVAPLLSARDPNQIARDAYYLEHLGRARLSLIEGMRAELRETEQRSLEIGRRRDRVTALEAEQHAQRSRLEASLLQRKEALAEISKQLQTQKREVATLRDDEQRLARVIDTLVKRAREAAAREAARRLAEQRAAERRAAEARAAAAAQANAPPPAAAAGAPARRAEPVVGEVRSSAGITPTGVRFAQLRGQLRFPVRGELVGRFGAPRAEGGTTWKGVFIRAGTGADVKAVAAGEVVYSDWLRGYGNLIIVDHGGDYLTVYGNNDTLLKEVGDAVSGGDAIASVGTSGGAGDSGLYFELRHQGRPLDPMQWVRLN
ncbi:murein hydrolase activator EnvC family protein [Thauera linaloolentis]|nr:peptidoglycan DD-metalloendopeptidase family protein [Thauera linaloolentis]MCM8564001.1 peptidoglycan DD-metalloendopeptidase family protein [Thauera linaloolentis]